ncbi:MAG: class E sortase [Nitriliruptoraceae bacterium]|nr:class E sortase [Nitriliruptoraceae bacterium]
MARVVRGVGWTLIVAGAVVLLYVVYLLWFTNFETNRAQNDLAQDWSLTVPGTQDPATPAPDDPEPEPEQIDPGDAYAALWFERDGERIVNDDVLYVVAGVSLDLLRAGPGHYPGSDRPGGAGNLAIAGHRTTYGSPFWSLDELQDGDTIHVMDRQGREWTYAYREQQIVRPQDVWVVGDDPLESGAPTITLTTCHPRGSARERLIAFGELIEDPIESTAGADPFTAPLPGEASGGGTDPDDET